MVLTDSTRRPAWLLAGLVALLAWGGPAGAVDTADIGFQGRLVDASGDPLEGTVSLEIGIWSAASGGSRVFAERHLLVPLREGVFSLLIGTGDLLSQDPLGPETFSEPERWLEVAVGGQTLSPRQPIASVPYAMQAGEDAVGTDEIAGAEVPLYQSAASCDPSMPLTLSPTCETPICNPFAGQYLACDGSCSVFGSPALCPNALVGRLLDPNVPN
jgi:hypothetical protein